MSAETEEWLNSHCLIGFTDKREASSTITPYFKADGRAWWWKKSLEGAEPNHYPGAIPVEDVVRRLFNFKIGAEPVYVLRNGQPVPIIGKRAISASDDGHVFNVAGDTYAIHQFEEWLIKNVANLLDSDLGIGSALLLKNRAVAVVQVEVPDNFATPEGVEYRPNLLAVSSSDSSFATIYKRTIIVTACDNSRDEALGEKGQEYKLKHRKGSDLRIGEARDALQIIFEAGQDFADEIARLCAAEVTEKQFESVLQALVPVPAVPGRSQTTADSKRQEIRSLYRNHEAVAPWLGTAWGVSQAFNTWEQHCKTVKSAHRIERNYSNLIRGGVGAQELTVLEALSFVLDEKDLVPA